MKTSTNNSGSKTDSTPPDDKSTNNYVDPAAKADPVVDDKFDDLGYEKDPAAEPTDDKVDPPADDKTKKEDDKPIEKPATGYGADDDKVDPPKADDKKEDDKKDDEPKDDAEKAKKEYAEVVKDLGPGFDKEKVTQFAIENKFTKEQLQAYVKLVKDEDAAITKQAEQAKQNQRKAWKEELKNDPDFGGDNFVKNVDRVEKVLEKHMPNTKKILTDKGSMLPPYIMRDLLGLAKALNPTTNLVQGEPPAPTEDQGNYLDEMYK
jgi:hypothetical protein